jgi:hypothetical protein
MKNLLKWLFQPIAKLNHKISFTKKANAFEMNLAKAAGFLSLFLLLASCQKTSPLIQQDTATTTPAKRQGQHFNIGEEASNYIGKSGIIYAGNTHYYVVTENEVLKYAKSGEYVGRCTLDEAENESSQVHVFESLSQINEGGYSPLTWCISVPDFDGSHGIANVAISPDDLIVSGSRGIANRVAISPLDLIVPGSRGIANITMLQYFGPSSQSATCSNMHFDYMTPTFLSKVRKGEDITASLESGRVLCEGIPMY